MTELSSLTKEETVLKNKYKINAFFYRYMVPSIRFQNFFVQAFKIDVYS